MYRCRNCNANNSISNSEISLTNNLNDSDSRCNCGFNDASAFPENYMYGQSYVPIQYINNTFRPNVALQMGSLYPELVSPYMPCQSMMENRFLRNATANEGRCPNEL